MMLKNILFSTALVCCVGNVLCKGQKKVACAVDDFKCTSSVIDALFMNLIEGRPDLKMPTSDPIHQDIIDGNLKDYNFTLTDAYLYGLKNCRIKKHSINLQQLAWTCDIQCSNLTLKSNYELAGILGGIYVEGKGPCQVVNEKFRIGMSGKFDFVTDTNGQIHFLIGDFGFHNLEVIKKAKYQFDNLYFGDEVKSQTMHKYMNDNWKEVSAFVNNPAMRSFIRKMMENISIYLAAVPADEIFLKTVSN